MQATSKVGDKMKIGSAAFLHGLLFHPEDGGDIVLPVACFLLISCCPMKMEAALQPRKLKN
jgi:hypothetical protein